MKKNSLEKTKAYKRKVIRALKKKGERLRVIKVVKSAENNLQIAKYLIKTENYDILIKVFGEKNANIAIYEYIEDLYKEMDRRFGSFWDDFFDEISQSHDMTVEVENRKESIEQCCSKAMQKIRRCHEIEERILENYRLALEESRVQNHEKCKSKRMWNFGTG